MSFKLKVIILSSLIIALTLILVIVPVFDTTSRVERSQSKVLLDGFKKSLASNIEISSGDDKVTLTKNDGKWELNYNQNIVEADSDDIDAFLDQVKGLKTGRLVQKNSSDFTEYGLDPATAVRVSINDSKNRNYSFFIGDEDASGQSRFLALEDETTVYETTVDDLVLETSAKEWAILKLFQGVQEKEEVVKIDFFGADPFQDDKSIELDYQLLLIQNEAGEEEWTIVDSDVKIAEYQATSIARKVASAAAYDYAFGVTVEAAGFANPITTINVTSRGGTISTLYVGAKLADEDRYYVMIKDDTAIYIVSKSTLSGLLKSKEVLIQK